MKRLVLITSILLTVLPLQAQDDDMYFVGSKKKQKTVHVEPQTVIIDNRTQNYYGTPGTGLDVDVDTYNRRTNYTKPQGTVKNDTLYIGDAEERYSAPSGGGNTYIINDYTGEATDRLLRFHDTSVTVVLGADPWYWDRVDGWYWDGFTYVYGPTWHSWGWYGPGFYGPGWNWGWHSPGWYGPGWNPGWYGPGWYRPGWVHPVGPLHRPVQYSALSPSRTLGERRGTYMSGNASTRQTRGITTRSTDNVQYQRMSGTSRSMRESSSSMQQQTRQTSSYSAPTRQTSSYSSGSNMRSGSSFSGGSGGFSGGGMRGGGSMGGGSGTSRGMRGR